MKIIISQQSTELATQYLKEEIGKIVSVNKEKISCVESSALLCSFLLDELVSFKKPSNGNTYKTGVIYNLGVYVNLLQRWDDYFIYLKNGDDLIETVEVINAEILI
jgi:hypothetical protein